MSAVLDLAVRVAALESGVAELESWRRDVEREVGDEDLLLGGAVLEDEERRKEVEDREILIEELLRWHRIGGRSALLDVLNHYLGPVASSAERAVVAAPRPLTPAEVEACRVAAETPLQMLAREVADAAARWSLIDDTTSLRELLDVARRWVDASGYALKAGEG